MLITDLDRHIKVRKGAIHVGGHTGEEAAWYQRLGFSPVVWFEPNPRLYRSLCGHLEKFSGHSAYQLGVHDVLTSATLHEASNDGLSSSILELGTHQKNHPDVRYVGDIAIQLTRLDDFFRPLGGCRQFNFLNIDVQGVELNVIKSLGEMVREFDYIYTEVNEEEVYKGCCLVDDIDTYLEQFGFSRNLTQMTHAHWGDALYVRG